ncbi:hypothetical protein GCM10009720_09420 [Yaniella flava]|uniref:Uncharacterized protein n=1 Tax=Yaniella flava TaxID=287930 RepID=A0ABN2U8Y2_9MICC
MALAQPGSNAHLMAGKAEAERKRTALRMDIMEGITPWTDYLRAAAEDPQLRNQSLVQIISCDPHIGYDKARSIVNDAFKTLYPNIRQTPKRITVGWVVSQWASGRRFEALLDAVHDTRKVAFHDGFPFTYGKAYN